VASVLREALNSSVTTKLVSSARRGKFREDSVVRVVSWNLHNRGVTGAQSQGELLRELKPDLMLLQEVNPNSAEILRQAAEADWLICPAELRQCAAGDRPVRSPGVAIAGRGPAPQRTWILEDVSFPATWTHWHTGSRRLKGEPGDDLLFGPGKIHPLQDGLRRWLADHPAEAAVLAESPAGPLAITYRTRKNSPGTDRRYDSIWLTAHWTVQQIGHLYDEGIAAGSDHAIVVTDLATACRVCVARDGSGLGA
jgi:hypothetical protein